MSKLKYLAAMAALHALARTTAGRPYSRLESRVFLWACRASARPYKSSGNGEGHKPQPVVVE